MKKLSYVAVFMFIVSCQGEPGPIGPQGLDGPPGPVGQAFEVETDFNGSNGYSTIFAIPDNIQVLQSDIVVVYLLWEVDEGTGNDVWQPLPVSVFFDDGELQYAFDHTLADVRLFLTGDTDLSTVGPGFTQDQIFRVVVLPADYVASQKVDVNNIEEIMNTVEPSSIQRLTINR